MFLSYKTHIFEEDKQKIFKNRLKYLLIAGAAVGLLVLLLVGLSIFAYGLGITMAIYIYLLYTDDKKFQGMSSYGKRKQSITIEETRFVIDDRIIPFDELGKLVIYVDEYTKMPREYFGYHHGGNNEITFEKDGKKVSFNYIIRTKEDFRNLEKLVAKIESKYSG